MQNCLHKRFILFFVLLGSLTAYADVEVAVRGLMKDSAVVEINGKQRVLKVGVTSPEGITLVSADSRQAVLDIDGQQHVMGISKHHKGINIVESEDMEFRIPRGNNGHFFTSGQINNRSANFVVDTGASAIAMSEVDAQRLGIQYLNGERITVSTAASSASGYRINLSSVTVGPITIYNVEAIVLPGSYPQVVLLGNSFLNRVDLQVDSGVLVLQAKF